MLPIVSQTFLNKDSYPSFPLNQTANFIVCFNQVGDQLFSDVGIGNFRSFLKRVDAKFIFR